MKDKKLKILIIDDDENILDLFKELEPYFNFESQRCIDGFTALEVLEKNSNFDLIVLDITLKGIDGYEICRRLKLDHRFFMIPIIMLTGKTSIQNEIKGYRVGADGYITKPFSPDSLFQTIEQLVLEKKKYKLNSSINIELGYGIESIKDINRAVSTIMSTTNISKNEIADLQLCFHEICHNAVEHGNKYDEKKRVFITIVIASDKIQVMVQDQGDGFDLSDILDPTEGDNLFKPRGRGIFFTKSLMDSIQVNQETKTVIFAKIITSGVLSDKSALDNKNDSCPDVY